MPVEGQWDRVNHPLRSTDRRALVVMACVTAIVVIGGVIFALTRPAHSDAGCVVFTVPASVGGATVRDCGGKAKTFCATKDALTEAAAECRRLGYLPG
jgi:hypothetical protein